jgi:hypothetical protein
MVITVKLNSNQHSEHIIPHCDWKYDVV